MARNIPVYKQWDVMGGANTADLYMGVLSGLDMYKLDLDLGVVDGLVSAARMWSLSIPPAPVDFKSVGHWLVARYMRGLEDAPAPVMDDRPFPTMKGMTKPEGGAPLDAALMDSLRAHVESHVGSSLRARALRAEVCERLTVPGEYGARAWDMWEYEHPHLLVHEARRALGLAYSPDGMEPARLERGTMSADDVRAALETTRSADTDEAARAWERLDAEMVRRFGAEVVEAWEDAVRDFPNWSGEEQQRRVLMCAALGA